MTIDTAKLREEYQHPAARGVEDAEVIIQLCDELDQARAGCNCFARMTHVRTEKELAIVPANIERDRFRDELNVLTEVQCTHCGTFFYVATFEELYAERDQARAELSLNIKGWEECVQELEKVRGQRDQARADVLKLRHLFIQDGWIQSEQVARLLTDTEHYEQYR